MHISRLHTRQIIVIAGAIVLAWFALGCYCIYLQHCSP